MRRALVVSLALLCSLGGLAACGDEDDGGAVGAGGNGGNDSSSSDGGAVTDPPASDTTVPGDTTPETTPSGARVVNPTPGLLDPIPTAIDSITALENSKFEVRFYGGVEGCHGVDRIEVEEGDADVTITVYTGTPPEAAARACIEIAELQAVIAVVVSPLGERVIIDGSSGAEVPLS